LPTIALQEIESQLAAESRCLTLIFPALSHGELLFLESDQKYLMRVVTMRRFYLIDGAPPVIWSHK